MKLKDTLTTSQTIDMLNGKAVGFFPYMILSTDSFYNHLYELCLGYYMQRSGEKTISVTYERLKTLIEENPRIYNTAEQLLGELIRGKFIDKWTRVYDTLITKQYDVLKGFEHTEHKEGSNSDTTTYETSVDKTGDNTDTTTYNSQNGRNSNNTDIITYDTVTEDNGKTGTNETTTTNRDNASDIYGFNSTSPVGDNTDTENVTETVIGKPDENTTQNTQKKTGTETKGYEVDETISKTGTDSKNTAFSETENKTGKDTKNFVIDEDITKSGRDATGAELVETELKLRNTQIFFDIIYADIDSIATLQIYI